MSLFPSVVLVGVAGALGAAARLLMVEVVARWWRHRFPLAIALINLSGAFALGVVTAAFPGQTGTIPRLLLGVGFLGGYTTFSTLSYDTAALAQRGDILYAWLNIAGSAAGGVVAAALGFGLGRLL